MNTNKRYFAIVGSRLFWVAVIAQFYLIMANRVESVPETIIRFFSFFTILTNTLAAIYFTAMLARGKSFFHRPGVLTAITVYITIVGLVYQVVLRQTWHPTGFQMVVDELLHTVNPLFTIIFWAFYENKSELKWAMIPKWLIYPFIYLTYILIRGSISGFYPYPFVDVSTLGLQNVLFNSMLLLGVFIFFSAIYIGVGKQAEKS